jgi:exonuclease V gamma subunit
MSKASRPIDEYVAEIEASFGGIKSNRTLVAELSGKERANERALYRELARVVAALFEQ